MSSDRPFIAQVRRFDLMDTRWHFVGEFSTAENAMTYIQTRYSHSNVAARIINQITGEFINVEGYLLNVPDRNRQLLEAPTQGLTLRDTWMTQSTNIRVAPYIVTFGFNFVTPPKKQKIHQWWIDGF